MSVSYASGLATVAPSGYSPPDVEGVTIPQGFTFTAYDHEYAFAQDCTFIDDGSDGLFPIRITATSPGSSSNLPANIKLAFTFDGVDYIADFDNGLTGGLITADAALRTTWSVVDALKPDAKILEWMVLVSLLSWARDEDTKSFGWWASALAGRRKQFGSFLWRLIRAKMLAQTVADAAATVRQALAWMVDQRIVDSVSADAERNEGRLEITISLFRGSERTDMRFNDLWEALRAS